MNIATRGVRNAFRNNTRAVSIIIILGLSMGLSFLMLIANRATTNKLNETLSAIGTAITVAPVKGANELNASTVARTGELEHVTNLTMVLEGAIKTTGTTDQMTGPGGKSRPADDPYVGWTNLQTVGEFAAGDLPSGVTLPSNFAIPAGFVGSSNPTDPAALETTSFRITKGTGFDGTKDQLKALISDELASKNHLTTGSTFTAFDQTFTITGTFQSENRENIVIVALPTVQRLLALPSKVNRAAITVDSLRNLRTVTDKVKHEMGEYVEVTSGVDEADAALRPLTSVQRVSSLSLIGATLASGIVLLLTMVMIVRERQREIGILKAIGGSNVRIMGQFMCEALTFTLIAAVLGLMIGIAGGSSVTNSLVSSSANNSALTEGRMAKGVGDSVATTITQVQTTIGWELLLYAIGAAVLIALCGSTLAAFFISKVKPAQALRSE
jgi:putative ABC transport system permease protein